MLPDDRDVELLECTLRDGSYAIDFKFTESDTALIVSMLSQVGFRWIEIGHGFGLGASNAGKGTMPCTEEALILAAKSAAGDARIGMFCIPGIASIEALPKAAALGLDFVRIGQDATQAESAFPYLERARKAGLIPAMNFMKSYAISAAEFGRKVKDAHSAGAEIVYLVDSVGGMLSEDVKAYLSEARNSCLCELGFHSHDNLKLAAANSIQAYRSGARFIDTTLYGIGRNAGNAASEVMTALFDKMKVRTGIDFFRLLDIAELYMVPLMSFIHLHDMMAVAMGYGQFHSSFLPMLSAAASKHNADPKRLAVKMGRLDPVNIDPEVLDRTACALARTEKTCLSDELISFSAPEFCENKINTSAESILALVNGMIVTCAKRRGARPIIELVPSPEQMHGLIVPELVLVDNQAVLGRITFGSFEALQEALIQVKERISLFLVDHRRILWAKDAVGRISEMVGSNKLIPIEAERCTSDFIVKAVSLFAHSSGKKTLLMHGYNVTILTAMHGLGLFKQIILLAHESARGLSGPDIVFLDNYEDWLGLNMQVDIILLVTPISERHLKPLSRALAHDGVIFSLSGSQRAYLMEAFRDRSRILNPDLAYSCLIKEILAARLATQSH